MIKEVAATAHFLETTWSGESLFFSWPEALWTEKGCIMQSNEQTEDKPHHITPFTEGSTENISLPYSSNYSRLAAPYQS
jgi:hypothetical protein